MTRRLINYGAFAALAMVVNGLAYFARTDAMRTGVFFDCAITVPLCYWLLLVRPGLRTRQSLGFIAALSVMRGAYCLSSPVGTAIAVLAEAALIGVLIAGRKTLDDSIPILRVMRAELAVFRYGLGRLTPDVPAGSKAFTIHETSGAAALFFVMAALTPVEALAMHWLLPKTLGWIVVGLSAYSALWMIAIGRSFAALPILVDEAGITLRRGLMAKVRVPRDAIQSVSRTPGSRRATRFAVLADSTIFIELNQPLWVELPLGIRRRTSAVSLAPDDTAGFLAAIENT